MGLFESIGNFFKFLKFDINTNSECSEGVMGWNQEAGTVQIGMPGGNVCLQVGQETTIRVTNKAGVEITNGTPVYVSGASGNNIEVDIADASTPDLNRKTIAIATENISNNQKGYVTTFGFVNEINTTGCSEGDEIFVAIGGGFTNIKPALPNGIVRVGICTRVSLEEGSIFVAIDSKSVKDILVDSGDLTIKTASGFTAVLDQPVYKDINIGGVALVGGASNRPSLIDLDTTNIAVYAYSASQLNEAHGAFELQHDYKEGTDLTPHIHWYGDTAAAGNVSWGLEYWINYGGVNVVNATTILLSASPEAAWSQVRENFDQVIDGSNLTIGSQVHFRLFRNGVDALDTYSGQAAVATFGIHYEIDTIGSRQVAVK